MTGADMKSGPVISSSVGRLDVLRSPSTTAGRRAFRLQGPSAPAARRRWPRAGRARGSPASGSRSGCRALVRTQSWFLLPFLHGFGPLLHAGQLMPPEPLEDARPVVQRAYRVGVGAIEHLAPFPSRVDEAHMAQYFEVLRDGRLPQAEVGDDI